MPPDQQQHQIKAHESHNSKDRNLHLSLAVGDTIQMRERFGSIPPQFCGRISWGCPGDSHLPFLPPTSREDFSTAI
ncbi:hypothetical protein TNCV_5061201 [Trichonephila clavipes]|nr:hypothetical protein TNCV_5061201 [Trichonephila clavipes]